MNKKATNTALIVAGIAIVLLIAIIFYEIFRAKPVEEESKLQNMITDPNAGLENMINDIYDEIDEIENEVVEESTDESEPSQGSEIKKPATSQGQNTISKEDVALQKAKEQYGESQEVYFSFDAVDSQGRYLVSVHELETTIMITSYAIDVDKGTIVEQ